jgi:hypothetical protein
MSRSARIFSVLIALLFGVLAAGTGPSTTAVAASAPVITKVGSGAGPLTPTKVVITGRNLKKANAVEFGTKRGTIVRKLSSTAVEVRTPKGVRAGTVAVRIHTGAGWSKRTAQSNYTFVAPPSVTKLSPASGPFTGGQRVTLTGKNLKLTKKVVFGTLEATILSKSATTVVVRTPVGVLGATKVKVTTPGGTSPGVIYTYVAETREASKTITPAENTFEPEKVEWVTGGYDADTGESKPWIVGLPQGAALPTVGKPFLVKPGTDAFPSGLTGTVDDIAIQTDESVRVTVTATDLEKSFDRLTIDYSGPVEDRNATTQRDDPVEVGKAAEFAIKGPTALFCKDAEGQLVPFGADLNMTVSDVDISQHLDLGGLLRTPKYDAAFTAEVKTTGKITVAAKATCKIKPAWRNAHRRIIPLGTTGATVSFGPTVEFKVSAKGTWSIVDRTRTTFAVNAELGKEAQFSKTSRNVESKHGGALSFEAEATAGVSVQFGILDRAGLEGKLLLGASVDVEAADGNVCVDGKLFMKLSVGLFVDALVVRWEPLTFSGTINLLDIHGCELPEESAPPGEPEIVSARLPDAQIGKRYHETLATADNRSGAWSVVRYSLPAGLDLDAGTGDISGTPTGPVGDSAVIIDFKDEDGKVATTMIRIMVQPSQGIGGGDIQVTLRWTGPADLDLHVLDPADEEIYYGHKESQSSGTLDHDANAACNGPEDDDNAVENVFWPPRSAPPGSYTAWVKVYDVCGGPLDWHLTVRRNGSIIVDETGTGDSSGYTFSVGQSSAVKIGARPAVANRYPAK